MPHIPELQVLMGGKSTTKLADSGGKMQDAFKDEQSNIPENSLKRNVQLSYVEYE